MENGLLEQVAQLSGFFISDLRDQQNRPYILRALRKVDWNRFAIEECCYALAYIFDKQLSFSAHREVLEFLKTVE